MKDYVAIADEYARIAAADEQRVKINGKEVIRHATHGADIVAAAKRYLKDRERAADPLKPPFTFDPGWANKACKFIEMLPHVEGNWESKTITLIPAQIFIIVNLFGFRRIDNPDCRRFTTLLLAVARKNAKSTLGAAIIIACWCLEEEMEPQAIAAATTGSQARIVWNIAKKMFEKSPQLSLAFRIKCRANDILGRTLKGGVFKPINAKASTQDGLNPTYTILDELHAHENHDLMNVLMSAGGARDNPLFLFTTTEGYENPGPWPEQREFAKQVLRGVIDADHYLAIIFAIDEDDDEFDESKWIKANPLMVCNPIIMKVNRELAIEAKAMPGKLAEFKIKRLNRPAATANGFVDILRWNKCAGKIDFDSLVGKPCWGALDLAATTDMNSWRMLWDLGEDAFPRWVSWGRYWVPTEQVKRRADRKTVPYPGWVASGWITQTPGDCTDYEAIKAAVIEDCERFNPSGVGYDPWNALQLATQLEDEGISMTAFQQGTKSYNPAMKAFEIAYTTGNMIHEGSPVMRWNMSNLISREDVNKNIAPDRKKAKDKVDGAVATIMTFGLSLTEETFVVVHKRKKA